MINLTTYKNRPAISVKTKSLTATFLHLDGAKLTSLINNATGEELLAVKGGNEYKRLNYVDKYVTAECSGFDDMFPTVDECNALNEELKGVIYPDHGESCRIPYDYEILNDTVVFTAKSKAFPITYIKKVSVDNGELVLNYNFINDGDFNFEFLWAGHIMLKGDDGTKVVTPFSEQTPIEFTFCSNGYDKALLPKNKLSGYQAGKGATYKFYYLDKIPKGEFSLVYSNGSSLNFTYDETKLPYLAIWLNNGEFQNLYSITPEPCTIPFDSPERAKKRGYSSVIPAKSNFEFKINVFIKD